MKQTQKYPGRLWVRTPTSKKKGRLWMPLELVLLWLGLMLALPNRGGNGILVIIGATLLGAMVLPLEYAAVTAIAPALLPSIFGGLPEWYMGAFRWIFLFGTSAILILRCVSAKTPDAGRFWSPFVLSLSAFVVAAGFSSVISVSPSLSLLKWAVLIGALISSAVFGTKLVQLHGGSAARSWVRAWIACLSPLFIVNFITLMTGLGGDSFSQGAFRGLSGNPNSLGAVLAVALPLFACPFIYRRRKPDAQSSVLLALTVTSAFLLVLSWSRASIGAFCGGLLVVWLIHPDNRLTRCAAVASLAVLLFLLFLPHLGDRFEHWLYKGKEGTSLLEARAEQWRLGIEAFQRSPILGVGFGITSDREEAWSLDSFGSLKAEQGSSLFALLGQTGLFGFVPFYMAILISLAASIRFARAINDPWLTGIVSSCCSAFANSFFEGWMAAPSSGLFWFLMFQLFFLNAVTRNLRAPRRAVFRRRTRLVATVPQLAPAARESAARSMPMH